MESNPITLSIILVNYNSGKTTLDCLASIEQHAAAIDHEVLVVDNGSQDESARLIEEGFPAVQLIRLDKNLGFGAANNRAAVLAKGQYLLLLNNDALLIENSLPALLGAIKKDPNIGIIGPQLRFPDGRFQLSTGSDLGLISEFLAKHFPMLERRRAQSGPTKHLVDWVSGACMLIPKPVYDQVGGFDETFFLYMEDADLCKRVRNLGYIVIYTRESTVLHHLGETTSRDKSPLLPTIKRGQLHYYAQHNSRFSFWLLKIYLLLQFTFNRSLPRPVQAQLLDTIRRVKP